MSSSIVHFNKRILSFPSISYLLFASFAFEEFISPVFPLIKGTFRYILGEISLMQEMQEEISYILVYLQRHFPLRAKITLH